MERRSFFKERRNSKRWRLELENTAYLVLSEARDRHIRLQQKTKGIRTLEKLLKRMKREIGELRDEDVILLIGCCLSALRYFGQKIDSGEYLMRHLLQTSHFCYIQSIKNLSRTQNHLVAMSVIRFLHDDDKWHSCDFATKVLRDLMQVQGAIHVTEVETEILLTFIAHMACYSPGSIIKVPNLEKGISKVNLHSYIRDINSLEALGRKNPILEMARVLHGVLASFEFKDFGEDGWVAFDTLITIYLRVVHAIDEGKNYEDDTRPGYFNIPRESKEWDMTESAIRGCLRNFVDDVMTSNLRFMSFKNPMKYSSSSIQNRRKSEMGKKSSDAVIGGGWDNLSQIFIVVLSRIVEIGVSQTAQYQLLDMLVTATRQPIGHRSLHACLPESLLSLLLRLARMDDFGANFRSLKLLQHILDRHATRFHITTPRIFKECVPFAYVQCSLEDLEYFKIHRKDVYDTLYRNFLSHSFVLNNLEALFCTVCLILVELQFPHIARDIAELMVNIQDAIIGIPDLPVQSPKVSAWIHATVVSVLSLISTIHGLTELETLVDEIVSRRSEVAPFLIPPLKAKHMIGDITDFQEDLFFSHALIRRCLTNACFENRKSRIQKPPDVHLLIPGLERKRLSKQRYSDPKDVPSIFAAPFALDKNKN